MTLQLTVPNMACNVCATNITNAIKALDAGATVTADPKTKQVDVDSSATETDIRTALTEAGYPAN